MCVAAPSVLPSKQPAATFPLHCLEAVRKRVKHGERRAPLCSFPNAAARLEHGHCCLARMHLFSERINYFCAAFPRIGWTWWLTWFSSAETDLHLPCWTKSSVVSVAQCKRYQGPLGTQCCPEGPKPANNVLFLSERAAREAEEHFVHVASSVFTEPNGSN